LEAIGSAGNGLSGLFGNSREVGTATCLKPGFDSTCGVLGRDGVPSNGVPMKLSPMKPPLAADGASGDGVGSGSAFSVEWLTLSFRDNNPLSRWFALIESLGLNGVGFRATDFSDITVSSIELGVPTFFSTANFWCRYFASASILEHFSLPVRE